MTELTSNKLRKMNIATLTNLADQLATKLQWLHSVGKDEEEPEQYKRLASELLHVANIIEAKEIEKAISLKNTKNKNHKNP